jgi:hypothetical protein
LDKQDQTVEQQVWQRVHSCRGEAPGNDLRQLQRETMELAAIYRGLAEQLTGGAREQARELYRGERASGKLLAGIGILSRQAGESVKLWQPGREAPEKVLVRCYHRTRRCMTEYLARSADPEFGIVFDHLAKRAARHCTVIAELLGSLDARA